MHGSEHVITAMYTVRLSDDIRRVEIRPKSALTPDSVVRSQSDANDIAKKYELNRFFCDSVHHCHQIFFAFSNFFEID